MLRTVSRTSFLFLLLILAGLLLWYGKKNGESLPSSLNAAAIFGVDTKTAAQLLDLYEAAKADKDKVRVFIMPGHEPNYGGAEYRSLKERDMTVIVGEHLAKYLSEDPHYEAVLGRDSSGWNPKLEEYFLEEREEIDAWKTEQQKMMKGLIKDGSFKPREDHIAHQVATGDVGLRLYGINKWAGEQDFDVVIHIHFNDYGSRRRDQPGEYSGYVIYVPDTQYSNASAAKEIAESVKERLGIFIAESNTPKERGGIVEDQELIALGSNNTADVPAMLIEYGYIYEPQFQDAKVLDALLKEYAYQTYLGLEDFFKMDKSSVPSYTVDMLPYSWDKDMGLDFAQSEDVLALQLALINREMYPPQGKNLRDCPISGTFGRCTSLALREFQKKYEIQGEDGFFGLKTRTMIESLFGKSD